MSENELENKVDELSSARTFQSPTLTKISVEMPRLLPSEPYPQCVNCPNSLWMALDQRTLRCWCQVMRVVSWDTTETHAIPLCDGIYLTDENSTLEEPQDES